MTFTHPVSGRRWDDGSWQDAAACRGPAQAIFFPPPRMERRNEKRRREERAKEICAACPVLNMCRRYALEIGEQHGIWGGLTAKERRERIPVARSG